MLPPMQTPLHAPKTTQLKRSISLPMITLYGLGTTIGGGIYVLIGSVAGRAGIYAPLSFIVAALMVSFTALSFAELTSRFPKSAGEAVFIREGLNSKTLAIIAGYLVVFNGIVSSAALVDGFVGYFNTIITVPDGVAIIGVIVLIGLLACWGISESITIAALITIIEIGGLGVIIWVGRDAFNDWPALTNIMLPPFDLSIWSGIFAGSFLAFYAFIGFEDMVNVAEEVTAPQRTLPMAIVLTLGITTLLYVAVALVVISAAPIDELTANDAPLLMVYQIKTGNSGEIISLISIMAVLNGVLIQVIMGSRVLYGMAMQGWSLNLFSRVHSLTQTPVIATLAVVLLTSLFAFAFELEALAQSTSLIMLVISVLVNLSLFQIKRGQVSVPDGGLNLPIFVPLAGFCVSAVFGSFVAIDLFQNF